MRIIKTRLCEMMPELSVFLDVDALGNTRLKDFEHIDISDVVLVFLTQGFFKSGPCAREIVRGVLLGKQIIAVLEMDEDKGGLTEDECRAIIAAPKADGTTWFTEPKYRAGTSFFLTDQAKDWAVDWGRAEFVVPSSHEVADAIFKRLPINWYFSQSHAAATFVPGSYACSPVTQVPDLGSSGCEHATDCGAAFA